MKKEAKAYVALSYGDVDNVKKDAATVGDILDRQGANFALHCIAEKVGEQSTRLNLSDAEFMLVVKNLVGDLNKALSEKL